MTTYSYEDPAMRGRTKYEKMQGKDEREWFGKYLKTENSGGEIFDIFHMVTRSGEISTYTTSIKRQKVLSPAEVFRSVRGATRGVLRSSKNMAQFLAIYSEAVEQTEVFFRSDFSFVRPIGTMLTLLQIYSAMRGRDRPSVDKWFCDAEITVRACQEYDVIRNISWDLSFVSAVEVATHRDLELIAGTREALYSLLEGERDAGILRGSDCQRKEKTRDYQVEESKVRESRGKEAEKHVVIPEVDMLQRQDVSRVLDAIEGSPEIFAQEQVEMLEAVEIVLARDCDVVMSESGGHVVQSDVRAPVVALNRSIPMEASPEVLKYVPRGHTAMVADSLTTGGQYVMRLPDGTADGERVRVVLEEFEEASRLWLPLRCSTGHHAVPCMSAVKKKMRLSDSVARACRSGPVGATYLVLAFTGCAGSCCSVGQRQAGHRVRLRWLRGNVLFSEVYTLYKSSEKDMVRRSSQGKISPLSRESEKKQRAAREDGRLRGSLADGERSFQASKRARSGDLREWALEDNRGRYDGGEQDVGPRAPSVTTCTSTVREASPPPASISDDVLVSGTGCVFMLK